MASTVIPTISSIAPKSIAYALTYGGTTYSSVDSIKNDYVVLHKNVGSSYSSSAINRVSLGTILSSATSTHTPGFVNLGYFESAYWAILRLSSKDFLTRFSNTVDSQTNVVRAYFTNTYCSSGKTYDSLVCIITNYERAIYQHLFIGGEEFKNYAYFTDNACTLLFTTNPWIRSGGDSLTWNTGYNHYTFEYKNIDSNGIDTTIFPYYLNIQNNPTAYFESIPTADNSSDGLMSSSMYIQFNKFSDIYSYLEKGNISTTYNQLLTSTQYKKLDTSLLPIEDSVTTSLIPDNVTNWQKIATLSPVLMYNNIDQGAYIMLTYSDYQFLQNLKSNLNLSQS